jgi:hypothetical protein
VFDRHVETLTAIGAHRLLTPDDIAVFAIEFLILGAAFFGTWRFALRLWRAKASGRVRALVWGLIPASIGGFLGYVEGTEKGILLGIVLTGISAVSIVSVATALWIPQCTRALLGTVLFEATALLIWAFLGVFWATAFA